MDDDSLKKIIAKSVYEDGKNYLKTLDKPEATLKPRLRKWLVAASIVFLLGVSTIFILQNRFSPSSEELYATYFSPYPNNYKPVVRGESDETTLAFTAYENRKYEYASKLFENLLKKNEDNNIRFYYALSLLSQNKLEAALAELNNLESIEFPYQKQVLWYKALLLLKLERPKEAKQALERLNTLFSDYKAKEATEILKLVE